MEYKAEKDEDGKWSEETVDQARKLRSLGYSYQTIGRLLELPEGVPWRLINRAQYRECVNESSKRWYARGRKAIYQGEE